MAYRVPPVGRILRSGPRDLPRDDRPFGAFPSPAAGPCHHGLLPSCRHRSGTATPAPEGVGHVHRRGARRTRSDPHGAASRHHVRDGLTADALASAVPIPPASRARRHEPPSSESLGWTTGSSTDRRRCRRPASPPIATSIPPLQGIRFHSRELPRSPPAASTRRWASFLPRGGIRAAVTSGGATWQGQDAGLPHRRTEVRVSEMPRIRRFVRPLSRVCRSAGVGHFGRRARRPPEALPRSGSGPTGPSRVPSCPGTAAVTRVRVTSRAPTLYGAADFKAFLH